MLEAELNGLRRVTDENRELREQLQEAESNIRRILKIKESIPSDCVMGNYCEACKFGTNYWYHQFGFHSNRNTIIQGILCKKGESCKNFIQKEIKE